MAENRIKTTFTDAMAGRPTELKLRPTQVLTWLGLGLDLSKCKSYRGEANISHTKATIPPAINIQDIPS